MIPTREIVIERTWDGSRANDGEIVTVGVELDAERCVIHVDAPFHGDPRPPLPPGRCPRLWEYEVVELFLVGLDERYLEIELGPDGHWLSLRFDGIRRPRDGDGPPLRFTTVHEGERWRGTASLAARFVPRPLEQWNAFAIHGVGEHRRFLAGHPVGGDEPDFHRIHAFPRWS